jgi:predicted nucleic acid-binding protein
MKYVVDSSVALKWVLPEARSEDARELRDGFDTRVHELLAPDVFPIEVAHALTRAERRRIIPAGHAKAFLADILQSLPPLHGSLALLSRATDLSSELEKGVYGCLYIALAEREHCEFVTEDLRLIAATHDHFPFVISLAEFRRPQK